MAFSDCFNGLANAFKGIRYCTKWVLMALVVAVLMVSCKPSVPSEYIQKGKMENILFDYHLAKVMFEQEGKNDSLTLLAYQESIFEKYDVTRADFDSSMVYYSRHMQLLHEIYEHLGDRLSKELVAQGGVASGMGQYGDEIAGADTASIWKGDRSIALTPFPISNSYSFEAKADTSFHKGDRIILDFDAQFIYQMGLREATAVLSVTFMNDSVRTETVHVSSSSHFHLQIEDSGLLGIKNVRGYFLLSNGGNGYSSTIRMCLCYNIKLLRMHVKREAETTPADSAKVQRPDSAKTVFMPMAKPQLNTKIAPPPPNAKPEKPATPSERVRSNNNNMPKPVQPLRPVKVGNLKPIRNINNK